LLRGDKYRYIQSMPKSCYNMVKRLKRNLYQSIGEDAPDAAATVILQAELLFYGHHYDEALEILLSFVDRKNGTPVYMPDRRKLMLGTIEELVVATDKSRPKICCSAICSS